MLLSIMTLILMGYARSVEPNISIVYFLYRFVVKLSINDDSNLILD